MAEWGNVQYGGFWRRVLALSVDVFLAWAILFPIMHWLGFGHHFTMHDGVRVTATWNFSFIVAAILFVNTWQATPGKMLLGLKVVDARTLGEPRLGQVIGRQLSYIISSFLFGLGFLWVAFDGRKQGWHDKLAGTLVIRSR